MPVRAPRAAVCLAIVSVVGMLAIACGGGRNETTTTRPGRSMSTSTTTPVGRSTSTTRTPAHQIAVSVIDGEVEGGARRERVEVGQIVEIAVTSDAPDELHVHGYNLTANVKAGIAGSLIFTADIPGVFEVELEKSGRKILELEVR